MDDRLASAYNRSGETPADENIDQDHDDHNDDGDKDNP
jgi:hypothetical protein